MKYRLPSRKNEELRPHGAGLLAGRRRTVSELLPNGDEILAANDRRLQCARLRTDLGSFHAPLGPRSMVKMVLAFVAVDQFRVQAIAIRGIAARLHDPIDDVQAEARIAKAGLLVEERLPRDPGHISLLADGRRQVRRFDTDKLRVLRDLQPVGRFGGRILARRANQKT